MAAMQKPVYSVIIPMYNEQEVIEETYRRLTDTMQSTAEPYELVFVNDGSRDDTMKIMTGIQRGDEHVRIVDFARNFGHQIAVSAGLDCVRGDAVIIIDADLQDPPRVVLEMIEKWKEGWEVVYGKRLERKGESFFKKVTASAFYRFLGYMSGGNIPKDTGDFRLIDRKVVEALRQMPEHNRFLRGMVAWVGFKQCPVEYVRDERWAGVTKYPLKNMIKLAQNGIYAFSNKPLSLVFSSGVTLLGAGALYLLVLLIVLLCGISFPALQWLMAVLILCTGAIIFSLGILGEYIGRIYDQAKDRPLYLVSRAYGFERQEKMPEDRGER